MQSTLPSTIPTGGKSTESTGKKCHTPAAGVPGRAVQTDTALPGCKLGDTRDWEIRECVTQKST